MGSGEGSRRVWNASVEEIAQRESNTRTENKDNLTQSLPRIKTGLCAKEALMKIKKKRMKKNGLLLILGKKGKAE